MGRRSEDALVARLAPRPEFGWRWAIASRRVRQVRRYAEGLGRHRSLM
jgi:hypothetical protein